MLEDELPVVELLDDPVVVVVVVEDELPVVELLDVPVVPVVVVVDDDPPPVVELLLDETELPDEVPPVVEDELLLDETELPDDDPPVVELLVDELLDDPVVDEEEEAGVGVGEGGADGGGGVATGPGVALTVVTSAVTVQPVNANVVGAAVWQPAVTTSRTLVRTLAPVRVTPSQMMSEGS